jgi:hypothetical protein
LTPSPVIAQLLLRQHPGENAGGGQKLRQRLVTKVVKLLSGDHLARNVDAGLAGDGERGRRIVSCDHDHANTGFAALGHRGRDRVSNGIGEPDQAEKREGEPPRGLRQRIVVYGRGNGKDAQALRRHLARALQHGTPLLIADRAERKDRFRRALRRHVGTRA